VILCTPLQHVAVSDGQLMGGSLAVTQARSTMPSLDGRLFEGVPLFFEYCKVRKVPLNGVRPRYSGISVKEAGLADSPEASSPRGPSPYHYSIVPHILAVIRFTHITSFPINPTNMHLSFSTPVISLAACALPLASAFQISSYRGSNCHGQAMGEFATRFPGYTFCEALIHPEASSVFVTPQEGDENSRMFSLFPRFARPRGKELTSPRVHHLDLLFPRTHRGKDAPGVSQHSSRGEGTLCSPAGPVLLKGVTDGFSDVHRGAVAATTR
jgi:hypothetical protein